MSSRRCGSVLPCVTRASITLGPSAKSSSPKQSCPQPSQYRAMLYLRVGYVARREKAWPHPSVPVPFAQYVVGNLSTQDGPFSSLHLRVLGTSNLRNCCCRVHDPIPQDRPPLTAVMIPSDTDRRARRGWTDACLAGCRDCPLAAVWRRPFGEGTSHSPTRLAPCVCRGADCLRRLGPAACCELHLPRATQIQRCVFQESRGRIPGGAHGRSCLCLP